MCVACGCHRNFHQRVILAAKDEDDEALRDEEKQAQAHLNSIYNIERVAHDLMAAANHVIPFSQDEQCHHKLGRVRDLSVKERNTIAKISIENLDHIAKVASSSCLVLVQFVSHVRPSPPDQAWGMPTPKMGHSGFLGGSTGID